MPTALEEVQSLARQGRTLIPKTLMDAAAKEFQALMDKELERLQAKYDRTGQPTTAGSVQPSTKILF